MMFGMVLKKDVLLLMARGTLFFCICVLIFYYYYFIKYIIENKTWSRSWVIIKIFYHDKRLVLFLLKSILLILRRCQGSTTVAEETIRYVMFDYRKFYRRQGTHTT